MERLEFQFGSSFMASGIAPWQYQVSGATQLYAAADQLQAGYKRQRGPGNDLQAHTSGAGMHHSHLIDNTISASVISGLGRSASNSPLDLQGSTSAYTGSAAAAAVSGPASGFGSQCLPIIDQSCLISQHQQHQQQTMGPSSTNNSSQDVSRLYKQYRTSQEYAGAEMLPHSYSSHTAAAAAAADPAAQLTADAIRAHQEQQMLRQQRQLLLQAQQAEAAAAAAKAAQLQQLQHQHQQQQAAMAAHAAAAAAAVASFGGSQASSQAAQPVPLYGQFRPAMAAQQHWDSSAAATSHPSHPSRHIAAPQPAAAAGLPPRPAVNSNHHHQHFQQHQSLFAAGSSSSSGASSSGTVFFPRSSSGAVAAPALAAAPAAAAAAAPPAGSARRLGAWSGAYAVMSNVVLPASQESEHTSGCFALECEEDLLSMGTGDGYYYQPKAGSSGLQQPQQMHEQHLQQQQQQYGGSSCYAAVDLPQAEVDEQLASLIEESGSTRPDDDCPSCDMEEDQPEADQADAGPAGGPADQTGRGFGAKSNPGSLMTGQPEDVDAAALVAAQAAAIVAQQAAEQRHSVVLQVLGRVASLRKGQAVLTATPEAAAAAGAASVRSRLLITEVSLYTNRAANSQMALDQSNVLMGKMTIPDDIKYMPVSPDSFLFKAGAAWQFPAFVICLGSSYLQRMLARLPQLAEAVLACPGFEEYAAYLPYVPEEMPPRLSGPEGVATLATLRSVQFTCLFLATKVAEQVHALGLLRFMLTNLSHNGAVVTLQQAANVEARCLEALEWRLGPFFSEDELCGDDEALWAECMGHWDYGTHGDHYPETF